MSSSRPMLQIDPIFALKRRMQLKGSYQMTEEATFSMFGRTFNDGCINVLGVTNKIAKKVEAGPKMDSSYNVWVTNIRSSLTAAKLKCHFDNYGKVLTAQILSNGTSYLGHLVMKSIEMAQMCVTLLNNTKFEGRNIGVSYGYPPKTININRSEVGSIKQNKEPLAKKRGRNRNRKSKSVKASENTGIKVNWRKKCKKLRRKLENTGKGYVDKSLIDAIQSRRRRMEKLETEIRTFEEIIFTRENIERQHAEDRKQLENDRREFDKQMDEVRRMKEHLQIKIKEASVKASNRTRARRIKNKRKLDDILDRSPPLKLGDQRKRSGEPIIYHDNKRIKHDFSFGFSDVYYKTTSHYFQSYGTSLISQCTPNPMLI